MSCPHKSISQGICDNTDSVSILTTRIFDNVRRDLDRAELIIEADITPTDITALYAGGTGVFTPDSGVTVTPHINDNYADVSGTLSLKGTVTYISSGTRQTASARLIIPIDLMMSLPADSIWPFDITVHFSYFADNLTEIGSNRFSALVDGVFIIYVTACVPISLKNYSSIQYNPASERATVNNNNFTSSIFYPQFNGN